MNIEVLVSDFSPSEKKPGDCIVKGHGKWIIVPDSRSILKSPPYYRVVLEITREMDKVRIARVKEVIKTLSPEDKVEADEKNRLEQRRVARGGKVKVNDPWKCYGEFDTVETALSTFEKARAEGQDSAFIRTLDGDDVYFPEVGKWSSEISEERDAVVKEWVAKLTATGSPKTWARVLEVLGEIPDEYIGFHRYMGTQSWHASHEGINLCFSRGRRAYGIKYVGDDPTMDSRLAREWEEFMKSANSAALNYLSQKTRYGGFVE